ncbi:D-alanyl-D-alanine carboxypeptidase family protein [Floccifex sp.]|uniref:D-alanyl-D-alanine carboxypeptidase family protein n=1 Tax=Floccifex sp. TaxID=2815810 RepID=UPI003EFD1B56
MKKLIVLFVLLIGVVVFMYSILSVSLKKDVFVFEYGKQISIDEQSLFKDSFIEPDQIELDVSSIEMEDKYPKAGEYLVEVKYQVLFFNQSKTIQVKVEDRTKPEIIQKNEIKVDVNDRDHDFSSDFDIKELSDYDISFDLEKVDFSKSGIYEATILVEDIYHNVSSSSFEIEVVETVSAVQNLSTSTEVNGILVVNKKHSLPSNYAPGENIEAKNQFVKLIADMRANGLQVSDSYSGYRSYEYQNSLYWNYVNVYGQQQADTFSARAGYSEHQTGLAFDLMQPNGALLQSYNESVWLANNAHRYGFIVRYPYGKENITGYVAEPWHIRYVGEQATAIYQSGLCLEEYLGIQGGDYN